MSKTQTLATIFVVALVHLHSPVQGQSTPMMYEKGTMGQTLSPTPVFAGPARYAREQFKGRSAPGASYDHLPLGTRASRARGRK